MPEYIYITLELSQTHYDELKAKLVAASLSERIFTFESAEHLDYNELPIKAEPDGDVSQGTWNHVKAKFIAAGLYDRVYRADDDPEGPEILDMSGTALRVS